MTDSAALLASVLRANGPEAQALRDRYRTPSGQCPVLSKWSCRRIMPRADTAAEIEALTGGLVPANGWKRLKRQQASKNAKKRTL